MVNKIDDLRGDKMKITYSKEEVDFYLFDLETKFSKIDKSKYMLSYSGGKDSHLLYWFIKEYMKDNEIEIVGINTRMEHPEIVKRIIDNCDTVLIPELKPQEIYEKYGKPCFNKTHDQYIYYFQRGSTAPSVNDYIYGIGKNEFSRFKLPKYAREKLLNGELPRISNKCCNYLKKEPGKKYAKKTGKHWILGTRADESLMRKRAYKGCFHKNGNFTPIWDLTDEMEEAIYFYYKIEIPPIYNVLTRTGCMGCPYGRSVEKELQTLSDNQYNYVLSLFKDIYVVKGINYERDGRDERPN